MTRRDVIRLSAMLSLRPRSMQAAACQSTLDPRSAADYEAYLKIARAAAEQPMGTKLLERVPDAQRAEALRAIDSNQPYVWNLHSEQPNGALIVYKGVIV